MKCRHCAAEVTLPFLDLGHAPLSNAYLSAEALNKPETYFPLRLKVCETCWLVQTEDYAGREALFTDSYAYFSSTSSSWVSHAERYVEKITQQLSLGPSHHVVEIAANDGYLLQFFKRNGVPCLGVEPTQSTAQAARGRGIEIREAFFGLDLAEQLRSEGRAADLIVANNVLAHVPDLNDFVAGIAHLLQPQGVATFEFPHLLRMVRGAQFDTAYHEHYSYFSFTTVSRIFAKHGLTAFDVEQLPTHGGSLRVMAHRQSSGAHATTPAVTNLLQEELAAGMQQTNFYADFQPVAERIKVGLLSYLLDARRQGRRVAAYGAAAKGNTLLNFAGIKPDLLPFVCDAAASKQQHFMPGSHIPIVSPQQLTTAQPDHVLILPWNLQNEITQQMDIVRSWGGVFIVAVPQLEIIR